MVGKLIFKPVVDHVGVPVKIVRVRLSRAVEIVIHASLEKGNGVRPVIKRLTLSPELL